MEGVQSPFSSWLRWSLCNCNSCDSYSSLIVDFDIHLHFFLLLGNVPFSKAAFLLSFLINSDIKAEESQEPKPLSHN